MRRWLLFVVGLAASILVTALLWAAGFPGFALFLLFPFFLFRFPKDTRPVRRCAACGFETREEDVRFCPRDGSPLQTQA